MRLTLLLPGLLMLAFSRPVLSATAHERPLPLRHRSRSACVLQQDTQSAPDPILVALAQRLRATFRQDGLPIQVHFDADVLVAEYHTHHEKLHLVDMTGKESSGVSDLIIPAADGVRLQLQIAAGDYVSQAVRPQTRQENYRTAGNKRAVWITYLDQYVLHKADRSLLLNFSYGGKVRPRWVTKIKAAARNGANETTQSASATVRQLFAERPLHSRTTAKLGAWRNPLQIDVHQLAVGVYS